MKIKKLLKKASKTGKKLSREFGKTPVARAAQGKRTKGFN